MILKSNHWINAFENWRPVKPEHNLAGSVMMRLGILLCWWLLCASATYAQQQPVPHIQGVVRAKTGAAIQNASVRWLTNERKGVYTNAKGEFGLKFPTEAGESDVLIVSHVGYYEQSLTVAATQQDSLVIVMESQDRMLDVVTVQAKNSITDEFSVSRLTSTDIYQNPNSFADPLRALTNLAVSTNTDESANPDLRGSASARSVVIYNEVPIYNPVRNAQINGVGSFSLFNTELIHQLLAYGSNPPLIYDGSTAGLIEVESTRKLDNPGTQIGASMAGAGFLTAQRFKKSGFLQVYGNLQFSPIFLAANRRGFEQLRSFGSQDAGVNVNNKLSEKISLNVFSYGINEWFNGQLVRSNSINAAAGQRQRNFNVLNVRYQHGNHKLTINHGSSFMQTGYRAGNIDTDTYEQQLFGSINYRNQLNRFVSVQSGLSAENNRLRSQRKGPKFPYAVNADQPQVSDTLRLSNTNVEAYGYVKVNVDEKWYGGVGVRTNIPNRQQVPYTSYQGSFRYKPNALHSFLIAAGKYYQYNVPSYTNENYNLLSSEQVEVEYQLTINRLSIQVAGFSKHERGNEFDGMIDSTQTRTIRGIEFSMEKRFGKTFRWWLANTLLDARVQTKSSAYRASNSMNYFLRTSLSWQAPGRIEAGAIYTHRPGRLYTPVTSAEFRPEANGYEPIFSEQRNSARYSPYSALGLTMNRTFSLGSKIGAIVYLTVNNVADRLNERSYRFTPDFTTFQAIYYQRRSFYVGCVLQLP